MNRRESLNALAHSVVGAFARANNKKMLDVLSYPPTTIARRIQEGRRWDQTFVD